MLKLGQKTSTKKVELEKFKIEFLKILAYPEKSECEFMISVEKHSGKYTYAVLGIFFSCSSVLLLGDDALDTSRTNACRHFLQFYDKIFQNECGSIAIILGNDACD